MYIYVVFCLIVFIMGNIYNNEKVSNLWNIKLKKEGYVYVYFFFLLNNKKLEIKEILVFLDILVYIKYYWKV